MPVLLHKVRVGGGRKTVTSKANATVRKCDRPCSGSTWLPKYKCLQFIPGSKSHTQPLTHHDHTQATPPAHLCEMTLLRHRRLNVIHYISTRLLSRFWEPNYLQDRYFAPGLGVLPSVWSAYPAAYSKAATKTWPCRSALQASSAPGAEMRKNLGQAPN